MEYIFADAREPSRRISITGGLHYGRKSVIIGQQIKFLKAL